MVASGGAASPRTVTTAYSSSGSSRRYRCSSPAAADEVTVEPLASRRTGSAEREGAPATNRATATGESFTVGAFYWTRPAFGPADIIAVQRRPMTMGVARRWAFFLAALFALAASTFAAEPPAPARDGRF